MTETDLITELKHLQDPAGLKVVTDGQTSYAPPDEFRLLLKESGLLGADLARWLAVNPRTVRSWIGGGTCSLHRDLHAARQARFDPTAQVR